MTTIASQPSRIAGADASALEANPIYQTPAMRQWLRFKRAHPECLLFFRMGDFYELFDRDAIVVHQALGLTLTERTKGMAMAGVPFHSAEGYLRRLIEQGFRVAICDQLQDPKDAKGVVDRGVTRLLTPGTLVDETLLDESRANELAAVAVEGDRAAIALIELSTGAFTVVDAPTSRLADELQRLAPAEVLFAEETDGGSEGSIREALEVFRASRGAALSPRPAWTFRPRDAADSIKGHFGVATLESFGLKLDEPALRAAGALLRYVLETQSSERAPGEPSGTLAHLRPPRRLETGDFVVIDGTSLRSLELERTLRSGGAEGTLFATIDRCRSAMGRRLLRHWISFPLRRRDAIEARQRRIAAIVHDEMFADALGARVGGIQDVARIAGRVGTGRATPRDVVALGMSVGHIEALRDLLDARPAFAVDLAVFDAVREPLAPLAERIRRSCVEHPPAHLREGGLFKDGIDATLDEARSLQRDANTWLASYQKQLIDDTNIPSLKVGFNKVFGFYIEITHANVEKIPAIFSRKQTLKNAERYITPELKAFEDKVLTAESRAIERERTLFLELCTAIAAHAEALGRYADAVASLDALRSLADIARRERWAMPTIVDEPTLRIRDGRHPVLEAILRERFVPNDCDLGAATDSGGGSLALITGPNMAGKSTFIRQVALIVLLAHIGSFVPATEATVGLVDRIFTRIGASDELHTGQSTFMVEMTETANILHHATRSSLVILDEIGRGTSTLDGLSLAWAIAETLAARGCRTLFATHYHELTSLAERLPSVTNLHVAVREWEDRVIFLHRILSGRTDRSYGIHVAKLAGLPRETIERASKLLETLAVETEEASSRARKVASESTATPGREPPRDGQFGLFTEFLPHPAVEKLKAIQLDAITPMQAFDLLRELKRSAGDT
ncbi:MAG: DNA mismatch repair protein MutS [Phycisphaerae bacterium]|nr:DNA mismatch repair protein MutS [Phycisphaerae bacterium]